MQTIPGRRVIMIAFLIFLLLPIYWLVNMSFKTNGEIVSTMTLWPREPTIHNYMVIFTDESWYSGYINSIKYVVINTVSGMTVTAVSVVPQLLRKRKMIRIDRRRPKAIASHTLLSEARTSSDWS